MKPHPKRIRVLPFTNVICLACRPNATPNFHPLLVALCFLQNYQLHLNLVVLIAHIQCQATVTGQWKKYCHDIAVNGAVE